MSGTDSTAQPSDERVPNRDRRPHVRKSPRANFPLVTGEQPDLSRVRGAVVRSAADPVDPSLGGGRGFLYQWEEEARVLHEEIATVAAGGGVSYVHHQTVPAATWVIDHHMSLIPNVLVLDVSGQEMVAEVRHPSDQTTVVVHSAPYIGSAYLRP